MDLKNFVAIQPIGAVEQHGPHLPLNVDYKIVDGLISLLVKNLSKKNNLLFLPTQKLGKSNEHLKFPGTLSLSTETLKSILMEIGHCVNKTGIKKLVLLNSHGGNSSLLDIVSRELRIKYGMLVFNINWFNFGFPDKLFTDQEIQYGIELIKKVNHYKPDIIISTNTPLDAQFLLLSRANVSYEPKEY